MNDEELLKRRILEFELELKMSHIEYGLPIVEVVNGDVVFCKDIQTLNAYKNITKTLKKKLVISVITISCLFIAIIACKLLNATADARLYIFFSILVIGLASWLYVNNKEKCTYDSIIGKIFVF